MHTVIQNHLGAGRRPFVELLAEHKRDHGKHKHGHALKDIKRPGIRCESVGVGEPAGCLHVINVPAALENTSNSFFPNVANLTKQININKSLRAPKASGVKGVHDS